MRAGAVHTLVEVLALSCAMLSPAAAQGTAASPSTHRVLVVYEPESTLPAVVGIARGLRAALAEYPPTTVEIYSEYLDSIRFGDPAHLQRMADNLAAKYAGVPIDVVMSAGPGALRFVLEHRSRIAGGAPLVYGAVRPPSIADVALPDDAAGVISAFGVTETVDLARRLLPDARRLVVLSGSAAFDRRWERITREALGSRYQDLEVRYLGGLSLDGFERAAAGLTTDHILLILTVFEDAAGRHYDPRAAAAAIAKVSGAPAFAVHETFIGDGVLGGHVETFESIGAAMAHLAEKAFATGRLAAETVPTPARPVIDWRQMQRWRIDAARLPVDAEVRYRDPTLWERYRGYVLAAATIIVLQSLTIGALIVESRRRRRFERALATERLELAHLSRVAQLGELSGAITHELSQPLTSILANAQVATTLLRREPIDRPQIEGILEDIAEDDRRATGVIGQLRSLMVKGESDLERLELNETVAAAIALVRRELVQRQTAVELEPARQQLPIMGNRPQLQQVVLNLVLNAAEAMAGMPPAQRRITVATRRREDGFSELVVADRGAGLSPRMRERAFKPFFTTKSDGLGLGLAICRSIAETHGGTLEFEDRPGRGAAVVFAIPPA